MTMTCETVRQLLAEGLVDRAGVERHAAECTACAELVRAADEIALAASGLRREWESPALWKRIETSLREPERANVVRFGLRQILLAAAAVVLVAGLGITGWMALNRPETKLDRALLTQDALDDVQRSEAAYVRSIDRLSAVAEQALETNPDPLMVSYRDKLMLLDDAIAECRANIDVNSQNAHLRRQLLSMYQEKQRTLRDILQEESHDRQTDQTQTAR